MKELKRYKSLKDKERELRIKLQLPGEALEENIEEQFKEITEEINKYEVAFQLLTEREKQIVKFRYDQCLSVISVYSILYITKSTYYEDIRSIETKIYSFFEGVRMNTNLVKL
ncbi:hypothetical protein [Cellulosilyticum sp. I15G10I2]|uniref:hypothetical protein n=1 Tax=Cellulosilyticum sp. I15G10I2 TaxID=1892843 RepID=UPI00085CA0FE|nr:hypothetical protein [Cellulosilyticum sp. I15G10I2]